MRGSAAAVPDFLIVGAMKSGTTSLFGWLGAQSEVFVPGVKEPDFFTDERKWDRGLDWYRELFQDAGIDQMTGEASVSYTDPALATRAAQRIAEVMPDAKLVFVVRDPIERLRSHYRHEVLRGHEHRRMKEAASDLGSKYVTRSMYHRCFEPYTTRFPREQICVVRFEDMVAPHASGWRAITAFLGLTPRHRPSEYRNASSGRAQFTPAMKAVWDAGLRRPPRFVPRAMRRVLKPLLLRDESSPLLATANDLVPAAVVVALWEDAERLQRWLSMREPLWERLPSQQNV